MIFLNADINMNFLRENFFENILSFIIQTNSLYNFCENKINVAKFNKLFMRRKL